MESVGAEAAIFVKGEEWQAPGCSSVQAIKVRQSAIALFDTQVSVWGRPIDSPQWTH